MFILECCLFWILVCFMLFFCVFGILERASRSIPRRKLVSYISQRPARRNTEDDCRSEWVFQHISLSFFRECVYFQPIRFCITYLLMSSNEMVFSFVQSLLVSLKYHQLCSKSFYIK